MFNFSGKLLLNGSISLPNTRFEIFDVASTYGWIGGGTTDGLGAFKVTLEDAIGTHITDGTIHPEVRVFKNSVNVYSTVIVSGTAFPVNISVPASSYDGKITDNSDTEDDPINYSVIYGRVIGVKGLPLLMTIRISETGFRTSYPIATTQTDATGYYEIKIADKQFGNDANAQKHSFIVEALRSGVVKGGSDYFYLGKPRLECNLFIEDHFVTPDSEFATLVTAINSVTGSASISSITVTGQTSELVYISTATLLPYGSILNVVNAHKIAEESGLGSGFSNFFYALIRTTQRLDLVGLVAFPEPKIALLITRAVEGLLIDYVDESHINDAAAAIAGLNVGITKATKILKEDHDINLGSRLQTIFGTSTADVALVNKYLSYSTVFVGTDVKEFWDGFKTTYYPDDATSVSRLKSGLQLLAITGFQPEMANHLLIEFGTIGVHKLAELTVEEWRARINTVSETLPEEDRPAIPKVVVKVLTDGETEPDPDAYAARLKEISQNLFPLTAIRIKLLDSGGHLLIDDATIRNEVETFIANNPLFDLRFHSIYDITGAQLISDTHLEAVQEALMPMQSMVRLVGGNPDAIATLITDGLRSALDITNMSPDKFIETYTSGSSPVLKSTAIAQKIYALADLTIIQTSVGTTQIQIVRNNPFTPGSTVLPVYSASPQLSTLFGSIEQCGCEYCMSVYSAAAYYTDIMNFLDIRSNTTDSAYVELLRRRPDLQFIDLTCKNTNTPVPYVDLVNELLEAYILDQLRVHISIASLESFQTSGTSVELAARAEHVVRLSGAQDYSDYVDYTHVYDNALSIALYPDVLPFNLALEQSRNYFTHLGISRYDLLNLYQPWHTGSLTATEVTPYNTRSEYIAISKESADIICNPLSSTWLYYGFSVPSGLIIQSPSDTSTTLTGTWDALLMGNVANGGIDVIL